MWCERVVPAVWVSSSVFKGKHKQYVWYNYVITRKWDGTVQFWRGLLLTWGGGAQLRLKHLHRTLAVALYKLLSNWRKLILFWSTSFIIKFDFSLIMNYYKCKHGPVGFVLTEICPRITSPPLIPAYWSTLLVSESCEYIVFSLLGNFSHLVHFIIMHDPSESNW